MRQVSAALIGGRGERDQLWLSNYRAKSLKDHKARSSTVNHRLTLPEWRPWGAGSERLPSAPSWTNDWQRAACLSECKRLHFPGSLAFCRSIVLPWTPGGFSLRNTNQRVHTANNGSISHWKNMAAFLVPFLLFSNLFPCVIDSKQTTFIWRFTGTRSSENGCLPHLGHVPSFVLN